MHDRDLASGHSFKGVIMTRLMMAAAAVALLAGTAQAADRGMEFRLGVTAHDLADHIEDGPNVTAELLFG